MGPCSAQYKRSPKVYSQSLAHIWLMTCPGICHLEGVLATLLSWGSHSPLNATSEN